MSDGPPGPVGAGQCIAGAGGAQQGGTYVWGEIVVCESQGTIEIRLSRPPEYPEGEVRLWHQVSADSVASSGADFEDGEGRVTWSPGDTADKVFTLTLIDDDEVEGDELIELHLSRYADDGYWNSYGERMQILVVDDDVDNAVQPTLVANINRGKTESAHVRAKTPFKGAVYFAADDGRSGVELWKSDGTEAGTVLVKDLFVGLEGSGPANFAAAGDLLYFTATVETHGSPVLFATDGTTDGTALVQSAGEPIAAERLAAHPGGVYFVNDNALWHARNSGPTEQLREFEAPPENLVVLGGVAYFTANDGASGFELWKSDGTSGGTALAVDVIAGAESSSPRNLIVLNGKVLFDAVEGAGLQTRQFYVSDGSAAGTIGLGTFNYGSSLTLTNAVLAEDRVFFTHFPVSYRGALFVTDGTPEGTLRLAEFREVGSLTAVGRDAYFSGNDDLLGFEPWKSSGTPEGTVMVADLNPTDAQNTPLKSSNPRDFFTANSKIYFTASTSDSDRALWRTDGTSSGTTRLDLGMGGAPNDPTVLGAKVFFTAIHESAGEELWLMDADTESTTFVRDINLVERGSSIDDLVTLGDRLLFAADDELRGRELWLSDGTGSGTSLLQDLQPGELSSAPDELTVVGSRVFFIANGSGTTRGLWMTDGSAAGAVEIPLTAATLPRLGQLRAFGDGVVFNMDDENEERGLWKSDGTAAGTIRIAPEASHLAVVGATIFMTLDGAEGQELWKSNGAPGGEQLVKDIQPGGSGSYPDTFVVAGERLFFIANDGTVDDGLWRSDGTEAGTVFLAELDRDSQLVASGDALYFSAQGQLWRADATSSSPVMIHERVEAFAAGAGQVYFTVETEDYDLELWKSDGTPAGARAVRTFTSSWLRDGFEHYAFVKGLFVFSTSEGFLGEELWRSDGTREGTFRVTDLNPGSGHFGPNAFLVLGDDVYFKAFTPESGEELWRYAP